MKKGIIFVLMIFIIGFGAYEVISHLDLFDDDSARDLLSQDEGYLYHYQELDETKQIAYQRLYSMIYNHEKDVSLKLESKDDIKDIYNAVLKDHPEFFYVDLTFHYRQDDDRFVFVPDYLWEKEDIEKYRQDIDDSLTSFLQQYQGASETEKIKAAYDYITDSIQYEVHENDQNIISAFIDKKSVCTGYAKAYQYLLEKLGIESTMITGQSQNEAREQRDEGHAWIMIHIDDDYYYSDPTWGDDEGKETKHSCYAYLLMNSQDMERCYHPDSHYEKTTKNQINIFQEEGCYMDGYDRSIVSQAVQRGLQNKTNVAEVKCDSEQTYQKVCSQLKDHYLGHDVLEENGCYKTGSKYYCNDALRVIELYYK